MKNFLFCTVSAVLMSVIFIFGFSILRSGEGMAMLVSARIASAQNSDKIKNSGLQPYEYKKTEYPSTPRTLTAEDLDSLVIDGKEIAFPIRLGDLPDEFSYSICYFSDSWEEEGIYDCGITLRYNDAIIATASFENDMPIINDDTILTAINFLYDSNQYLPQIKIAGIDVYDADMREINRAYGYDSNEYGYSRLWADSKDGTYSMKINTLNEDNISSLFFKEKNTESENPYNREIKLYKDEIALPEGYAIENDTVNSEMEYIPLTEKNEEFLALMSSTSFGGDTFEMPCTLNALMSRLGKNARFITDSHVTFLGDYGVYKLCGDIKLDGDIKIYTTLLITPGKPIGEAQVIEVSFTANDEYWEHLDLDGENPYGLIQDANDDYRYYLTDMKYNNYTIYVKSITLSYWGENTEKTE